MEDSTELRKQIFSIIENQIKQNDPPETKTTFNRLLKEGFDEFTVMQLIGQCLSVELFDVLKHGKPYDNNRYKNNLKKLPKEPF